MVDLSRKQSLSDTWVRKLQCYRSRWNNSFQPWKSLYCKHCKGMLHVAAKTKPQADRKGKYPTDLRENLGPVQATGVGFWLHITLHSQPQYLSSTFVILLTNRRFLSSKEELLLLQFFFSLNCIHFILRLWFRKSL